MAESIADKLQTTLNSKQAIKVALQDKDVSPTNDLSTYAGLIDGLSSAGVARPSIVAPLDGATGVDQAPIITGSRYNTIGTNGLADPHKASTWDFASDAAFSNMLHTSGRDTSNLTSYDLSAQGVKFEGITVYARVTYESESGSEVVSETSSFETRSIAIGVVIDGDIVCGQSDGKWYLAAPASKRALKEWGDRGGDTELPNDPDPDPNSSKHNTDVLIGRSATHPAAEYCRSLSADYQLPNRTVATLIYDNKDAIDAADESVDGSSEQPTLANIASEDARDGSNSRSTNYIWSSTEYSSYYARTVRLSDGSQNGNRKDNELWVVPVRTIAV